MTNSNNPERPPRTHTTRSFSERPSTQQPNRETVFHARDELERERELYSAHDPRRDPDIQTPAQKWNEAHSSWHGWQGTGSIPAIRTQETSAIPTSHTRNINRTTVSINDASLSTGHAASDAKSDTTESNSSADNATTSEATGAFSATRRSAQSSQSKPTYRTSQRSTAAYRASDRYRNRNSLNNNHRIRATRVGIIAGLAVVLVAVIGVFAYQNYETNKPVAVTINGESFTIEGEQRTLNGILDANLVSVTPGNYVAVDNSVMREGEGTRAVATVNDEAVEDLDTHLEEGDTITLANGTDIMESYTEGEPEVLPYETKITGVGAVHLYTSGKNGQKVTRTGDESGITAEVVTEKATEGTVQCYNVNTNGDKVIALTFDDGPWDTYTEQILDILDENGAKATFFTVGKVISGHEDLVKRAAEAGHEIGTHTWDHAAGSGKGVSLIKMSSDERKEEVTKGLEAIKNATGSEASTIFRAPGGNFDDSVATDLRDLVTAEIGWNVDTNDWQRPGASTIASRIESARPGNIILMHDGGGDRSQTVEALRTALPKLKSEGYSFVTVQELIEKYPYQESAS